MRAREITKEAGQVWWCDGAALAFDAGFKTRPVLIIALEATTAHVVLLSSGRRYGQETAVVLGDRVSFMTGQIQEVPQALLVGYRGTWSEFDAWRETHLFAGKSQDHDNEQQSGPAGPDMVRWLAFLNPFRRDSRSR